MKLVQAKILIIILIVFISFSYKFALAETESPGANVNLCTTGVTQPACYASVYANPQVNWSFNSGTTENSDGDNVVVPGPGNDDLLCGGFACPASIQSAYYVEICSNAGCGTVVQNIGPVSSDLTYYTPPATTLVPSNNYWYRVKVLTHPFSFPPSTYPALVSETNFTGTHAFTTNPICAPGVGGVGIGENLNFTLINCSHASFSWTDNCTLEASFTVQKENRDIAGIDWQDVCNVLADGPNGDIESCLNQTLLDGVHWDFRVKTSNSSGDAYSAVVQRNTALCDPSNLTVSTVDCTKVRMNWDDNSSNENAYETGWWNGSAWISHVPDLASNSERRTVWQPTDISRLYSVRAKNNAGFTTSWLPGVSGMTEAYCAPDNLKVDSYNCDCANLSWNMIGDASEIDHYEVFKNVNNRGWNSIATLPGTALTYSDCGIVSNSQSIKYYVVAENLHNVSNIASISGVCIKLPVWKESR